MPDVGQSMSIPAKSENRDAVLDPAVDPGQNLMRIKAEIEAALSEASRPAGSVGVVAVSKQHDVERITLALKAGHRVFGENRVQEAQGKWPGLKEQYSDIDLHLIGPLQTNKTKEAVALFDVIESVDRPKLARALASEMEKQCKRPRLLIQVNTGEEAQKSGVAPDGLAALLRECREACGLEIDGLMCIPPAGDDPSPHFALMAKLAAEHGLTALSMGMSGDYTIAAQLGATLVRVGTGIFGVRKQ